MSVLLLSMSLVLSAEEPAPVASAPEGQRWSVVGGRTAGAGSNTVEGGIGWPGLSVAYARGVASNVDLGVRVTFNYGLEGLVTRVLPGAKLQGVVKFRAVDAGAVSFGLVFEPGPLFAVDRFGNGLVGFSLPVSARLGISLSSAMTLGFSLDVPLWVEFGGGGGVNLPILPGLGLEYFIKSELLAFFKARMGPTLRPFSLVELAFDAHLGIGYRF
jgi:hypothetical protein